MRFIFQLAPLKKGEVILDICCHEGGIEMEPMPEIAAELGVVDLEMGQSHYRDQLGEDRGKK